MIGDSTLLEDQARELKAVKAKIREYFRAREEFFLAALGASTPEAFQLAIDKVRKIERELREAVGI
jgi:hypothetical protein